jgi:hypothetical protein
MRESDEGESSKSNYDEDSRRRHSRKPISYGDEDRSPESHSKDGGEELGKPHCRKQDRSLSNEEIMLKCPDVEKSEEDFDPKDLPIHHQIKHNRPIHIPGLSEIVSPLISISEKEQGPSEYDKWLVAVSQNKGNTIGVLKKMEKDGVVGGVIPVIKNTPSSPTLLAYRPPFCPW